MHRERENYIGRDYENNAGYGENYNSPHEGHGLDDERVRGKSV
jgi:hypothetical protein